MSALGAPRLHATDPNRPPRGVTHAAASSQDDTAEVGWIHFDDFKQTTTPGAMFSNKKTAALPQSDAAEVGWVSLADLDRPTTPCGMFPIAFELSSKASAPFQEDTAEVGWISFDNLKRSTTPRAMFPDTNTAALLQRDKVEAGWISFDDLDKSTTASELSSNQSTPLNPSMFGLTNDIVVPKLGKHRVGLCIQSSIRGDSQPCVDEHRPLGPKAALTATTLTPQLNLGAELLLERDSEDETCLSIKIALDDAQSNSCMQTHGNEVVQHLDVTHHEDQWKTQEVIESSAVDAHEYSNIPLRRQESCARSNHQQKVANAVCLDVPARRYSEQCCALSVLHIEALQVVNFWFVLAGFSTWPANTVCKRLMMKEHIPRTIVDSWFALGPALDFHELTGPKNRTRIISVCMDTISVEQIWSVRDETPVDRNRLADATAIFADSWFGLD